MTPQEKLKHASDQVDTWPDWKLDSYSLRERNKRREGGEILPKPTKVELLRTQLAAAQEREAALTRQLEELKRGNMNRTDDPATISEMRKGRSASTGNKK